MAGEIPTWHEDFLRDEVQESATNENTKSLILTALEKAEVIKTRFKNNPKIQKEYDDIRIAIIGALQDVRISTSADLQKVRESLTGDINFHNLSDGDISPGEATDIMREAEELNKEERYAIQDEMFVYAEKHHTTYGPIINDIFNTDIPIETLYKLKNELRDTGSFSLASLEDMRYFLLTEYGIDTKLSLPMSQKIQKAYKNGSQVIDIQAIIQEYMDVGDFNTKRSSEATLIQALDKHLWEQPELIGKFLFEESRLIFGGTCQGLRTVFIESLKERYYESREIAFETSVMNYYTNNNIDVTKLPKYKELLTTLRKGNCNIDYIAKIRSFNDSHDLDIPFTQEDARNIIGSTIKLRKTENEITLMGLRDELSQITGKKPEEIQVIFDSQDPKVIGEFLSKFMTNKRIGEIEGEIFELLDIQRDIQIQEMTLERIISEAKTIYGMDPQFINEYRQKLLYDFENIKEAAAFIEGLDEFSWSQANIDYVRDNPKERISEIKNRGLLLKYFREFPKDIENNIRISDLYPSLLSEPEIFLNFPGEIYSDDLSHISHTIFIGKPHLIQELLVGKNDIRNLITYFSQNKSTLGDLYTALINISKQEPENDIFSEINYTLYNYDKNNGKILQEFIPLGTLSLYAVSEKSKELLESKIQENGIQTHIDEIDIYLQKNPKGILRINDTYLNQTDAYIYFIKEGYFGGLRSLHWNPDIPSNIVEEIIKFDIGSVRFIAKNKMGEMENITLLIHKISETENLADNINLLMYINIMGQGGNTDSRKAIDIALQIKNQLGVDGEKIGVNINGSMLNMIAGVLKGINTEDIKYITQDKERSDIFQMLVGILQFKQATKELKDIALKVTDDGGELNNTKLFLKSSEISEEGKEKLLEELESKREISQEIMNILIKEFGENKEKLSTFVGELKSSLEADLKNSLRETETITFELTNIPEALRRFYIESNEGKKQILNIHALRLSLQNFNDNLSEENKSLGVDEKRVLFLKNIRNSINPSNEAYQNIVTWLDTIETLTILQNQGTREIITEALKGTLNKYNQNIREQFYDGKIFYTPINTSGVIIPIGFPKERTEKVTYTSERIGGTINNPTFNIGEKEIPISKQDLQALNTLEAETNFIKFYEILQELNMEEFWKYKDTIFSAISNKSATSGLNLNDAGYIDKGDMSLFLYAIADSISHSNEFTESEKNDIQDMRGQKQNYELVCSLMQRVNKQTGLTQGGDETVLRDEGRAGRIFREMYLSKSDDKNVQSLIFNRDRFEESLGT